MAIWLVTSQRKGVASTQLARHLKITQKTAWFMLHRLRYAAQTKSFNAPLSGIVEVDEAAIGGIERFKHAKKKQHIGRGSVGKTMVLGMRERGGELRMQIIADTTAATLKPILKANIQPGSTIYTDEHGGYNGLSRHYAHATVAHSRGEYVRGEVTTNSIESVWAVVKKQYRSTHHWVSIKHLPAYLDEVTFRLNRTTMCDGERVNNLLSQVDCRLTYKALVS